MIKTQDGDLVSNSSLSDGANVEEMIAEAEVRLLKAALDSLGYRLEYLGHEIGDQTDSVFGQWRYMQSYARLIKLENL